MTAQRPPSNPLLEEIGARCVMIRTRRIARIITADYEAALQPFGIGAAQFALLIVIAKLQPASRAAIGRFHHQDRSTLTRNFKLIIGKGWVAEVPGPGRSRPVVLTEAGMAMILGATPAWRAAQAKAEAALGPEGLELIERLEARLQAQY